LLPPKEKHETAEKRARASLETGVGSGALNQARNLTSANSDTSKKNMKNHNKK
jgi:hypothetical protein